jgi:hypothetical protein
VSAALEERGRVLVPLAAFVDGLPVDDGGLLAELERAPDGTGFVPVRVTGRFHPAVTLEGSFESRVEEATRRRVPPVERAHFRAELELRPVACETAPGVCRRAFEATEPLARCARREVIDGETGAVLASFALGCAGLAEVETWERDPRGRRTVQPLEELTLTSGRKRATTDESGHASLTGEVELSRGLTGPLVRVWPDSDEALTYSGPADFTLLAPSNEASSVHQDEAAAFVYATTYNAYMRATYPSIEKAAKKRYAIVVASDFENAFFTPTRIESDDGESFPGYVDLGVLSRKSAARDATVVKHEYTHALLNGCAELYGNDEALGVNEGLADYFPCAFYEHPRVGEWLTPPYVRALDDRPKRLRYPDDLDGDPHRTGNIFNQALWDARTAAERAAKGGRLEVDQAVFAGVLRMPAAPTLADARDAILAGDAAVNRGAHARQLSDAFDAHGITGSGDDTPVPDAGDVSFTEPTRASFVVHTGDDVEIPVEATSASGENVSLASSALPHARFLKRANGSRVFHYLPDASDRGRHTVTFTATTRAGSTTRAVTIVVRQPRK